MRRSYVYRLDVTYPPNSLDLGWEPPGYDGWDDPGGMNGNRGEWIPFSWPQNRLCLSAPTAKRRADLFRKYGAKVTIVRSAPIEWPEVTP
jgi:hypothetical protein